VSFHCSFVAAKYGTPACAASSGNVEGKPNVSGSQATFGSTPTLSRIQRIACANWRSTDSPLGACMSGSTHSAATLASHVVAARSRTRSASCASAAKTQA
jgi:hypothetical protein